MAIALYDWGPSVELPGGLRVGFEFAELGRGASLAPAPPVEKVDIQRHEIRYERAGLTEWYRNGPVGLEQGFELRTAPPGTGDDVVVSVALKGTSQVADRNGELTLADDRGIIRGHYGALFVEDANGNELPSSLRISDGRVQIHFDDEGARYPVSIDPFVWSEAKLEAQNPGVQFNLGLGLAISPNTVVGSTDDDAIRYFTRLGAGWNDQGSFNGGSPGSGFGFSLSLSGDTLVSGSPWEDPNLAISGEVDVYRQMGASWAFEGKLWPNDSNQARDLFGYDVGVSGNTLVAGMPGNTSGGAAYVFVRNGAVWSQQAKLVALDADPNSHLGLRVDIDGDTVIAGDPYDDDNGVDSGSAYIFVRNGTTWNQQAKLTSTSGAAGDEFGSAVAISGDTVVVGAYGEDHSGTQSGSVYVFVRTGTTWTQQVKLTRPGATAWDRFGHAVAVNGNWLVVGAPQYQTTWGGGPGSGEAYVFQRVGSAWSLFQTLTATDGAVGWTFGFRVATVGAQVAVSAVCAHTMAGTMGFGAIYMYSFGSDLGDPCALNADCAGGLCVDGVCCDSVCGFGNPNDCQACNAAATGVADGTCAVVTAGPVCRPAIDICDVAESCDGISMTCPADDFATFGTTCRPAADVCDAEEQCFGSSPFCPVDADLSDGSPCPGGMCITGVCTPSGAGGGGGAGGSGLGGGGAGGVAAGGSAAGGNAMGGAGAASAATTSTGNTMVSTTSSSSGAGGSPTSTSSNGGNSMVVEQSGCHLQGPGSSSQNDAYLLLMAAGLLAQRRRRGGPPNVSSHGEAP